MGLNVNNYSSGGGAGSSVTVGNHMGRLVQVVDKGIQQRPAYQGQAKEPARMISMTFELPYERIEVNGENKPRWISTTLTASMSPKANLTKFMRILDPNNQSGGELSLLVGAPVMANVVNKVDAQGNVIEGTKLDGISPVPQGFEVPPLENAPRLFDFDNPDLAVFDVLPEWLRGDITSAVNFQGSALQQALASRPTQVPQAGPQQPQQPVPNQAGQPTPGQQNVAPAQPQAPAQFQGYVQPGPPAHPTPPQQTAPQQPQGVAPQVNPQLQVQAPATAPGPQQGASPVVPGQQQGSVPNNGQPSASSSGSNSDAPPPATPAY